MRGGEARGSLSLPAHHHVYIEKLATQSFTGFCFKLSSSWTYLGLVSFFRVIRPLRTYGRKINLNLSSTQNAWQKNIFGNFPPTKNSFLKFTWNEACFSIHFHVIIQFAEHSSDSVEFAMTFKKKSKATIAIKQVNDDSLCTTDDVTFVVYFFVAAANCHLSFRNN